MRFKGTMVGIKRDVHHTQPKTLMVFIQYAESGILFRDHCWVKECKALTYCVPKSPSDTPIHIEFDAVVEEYKSMNGIKKRLKHIRNVKLIERDDYGNREQHYSTSEN